MAGVRVCHLREDAFEVQVRGYALRVDQPSPACEAGPTPVELFVSSLAACVAHHAEAFLRREGLPRDGLVVDATWTAPAGRLGRIQLRVRVSAAVPPERRAALSTAVEACAVHDALRWPPRVTVETGTVARRAAVGARVA